MLEGLIDGELDRERAAQTAEHVDSCPACGRWVDAHRALKCALSRLVLPSAPAELRARMLRALAGVDGQ